MTPFVALYLALGAAAIGATAVVRWWIARGPVGEPHHERIGPEEAAYLNGGRRLATYAAVGKLRRCGAIGTRPDGALDRTGPMPMASTALDNALWTAAGLHRRVSDLARERSVGRALDDVRSGLESAGLLPSTRRRWLSRLAAILVLPVLALGAVHVLRAAEADRPFAWVVAISFVLVYWLVWSLNRTPGSTLAARRTLEALRSRHHHLAPGQAPSYATYDASAAAMGVALFGAPALRQVAPEFATKQEVRRSWAGTWLSTGPTGAVGFGSASCGGYGADSGGGSSGGGGGCGGGGGGGS
ncbi:TIGR04222 domain-containing membrane protein [Asanoa sp. WMMD1127]|uniref:TIGR04222 domain-containing membrane protein n=1 Tax=Asanoa sp. WMMD1127 TaxID=3016107 RepID=UPI002415AF28|nr:TIGR04222 domain-containing membrane protein [Asanoa sp. WMMD1127]MDG4826791.1 TIGR04222 domain-containing membrane protein [Asanoa sp. WMMD1127]